LGQRFGDFGATQLHHDQFACDAELLDVHFAIGIAVSQAPEHTINTNYKYILTENRFSIRFKKQNYLIFAFIRFISSRDKKCVSLFFSFPCLELESHKKWFCNTTMSIMSWQTLTV